MSDTFGARLRESRERRQISLSTIAEQTKIKASLLEGLERGDVSHWPGGIFRRAFVRAYAQAIGLDPDVVVREFVELYPDPGEVIATATAGAGRDEIGAGPGARLRAALGATFRSFSRGGAETGRLTITPERSEITAVETSPLRDRTIEPELGKAEEVVPVTSGSPSAVTTAPAQDPDPPTLQPDLAAVADVCTALARVGEPEELPPLLQQAAAMLEAAGLVLWLWDPEAVALRAALAHGYSDTVLAQLPAVERDADNATAAAFRLTETCVVAGHNGVNGALAVPLMTPAGCGGVLAIELPCGREQHATVRAAATIVAAQLSAMMRLPGSSASSDRKLA